MRMIDGDAFIDKFSHIPMVQDTLRKAVDSMPTVDAISVVKCKDCKHWKTAEGVNLSKRLKCCTYHIGHKYVRCDEDFCSRGERKDGGNEALIKLFLRCYVRRNPDVRAWHIPIDDGCIIITVYKRKDGDHHDGLH